MKVAILGGGNMGLAFARCFVEHGLLSGRSLLIVEARESRRIELKSQLDCALCDQSGPELSECDVVILAVKPQDMSEACSQCRPFVSADSLVISMMAGITLDGLAKALGRQRLVRCMPNMPVQIGLGMTVYIPSEDLSEDDCRMTESLLHATGDCLRLASEDQIDAATAVSGSGPGFVFYFIEHMLKATEELGFSAEESRQLVARTFQGSVEQWASSMLRASELREMVTSKGGTMAAATSVFEEGCLGDTFIRGIKRAYERSRELAQCSVEFSSEETSKAGS